MRPLRKLGNLAKGTLLRCGGSIPSPPSLGTSLSPPRAPLFQLPSPSLIAIKRVRPRGLRALQCPASYAFPLAPSAVNHHCRQT